jgi:hypothetical protein
MALEVTSVAAMTIGTLVGRGMSAKTTDEPRSAAAAAPTMYFLKKGLLCCDKRIGGVIVLVYLRWQLEVTP